MTESMVVAAATGGPAAGPGWDVPRRGLTEEHRHAVRSVLADLMREREVRLAVVSGSLVAGVGHAVSDVDLYVVSSGEPLPGHAYTTYGPAVHVSPVREEQVRRLADHAADFRVTSADRSQLSLGPAENKLLLRLLNGERLLATDPYARLLDRMDVDVVRRLVMLRHGAHAVELQEDVFGALRSGDPYTALTAAHRALLHSLEAGLAGVGDVYDHEKVVFRRLLAQPATVALVQPAWSLLESGIRPGAPADEVARVARDRLLLGSLLVGTAMLDGWDRPAGAVPSFAVGAGGPLRSPYFGLLRFADGIALSGPDTGFRVSERMARLWLALDGRPIAEAARAAFPDSDAEPSAVEAAARRLVEFGAVEMPPGDDREGGAAWTTSTSSRTVSSPPR